MFLLVSIALYVHVHDRPIRVVPSVIRLAYVLSFHTNW